MLSAPGTTVIPCDLGNLRSLSTEQCGCCDAFYHFGWAGIWESAQRPARDDPALQGRNIGYTLDAVELAARLGCGVFVGAGSHAECGRTDSTLTPLTPTDPESNYGIAKLAASRLSRIACRQRGIRHVWARILSTYGPGDHAQAMMMSCIRSLLRGEHMSFTKGEQRWDYLYILAARDVINPAIEVGLGELPYPSSQVMHLEADISALVRDTGFEPTVPFEEGVRLTANWLKENSR